MRFGYGLYYMEGHDLNYLKTISELGFDYVELSLDYPWPYVLDHKKVQKKLDEYSLGIAFHGPWGGIELGHPQKHIVKASLKSIKDTLAFASKFDYLYYTMHIKITVPYIQYDKVPQECFDNVKYVCRELRKYEKILIENNTERFMFNLPEHFNLFDLDICLDVGHAVKTSKNEVILREWFRKHENRIKTIHMHDCKDFIDDHLSLGYGDLDTDKILSLVSKSKAEYLMLETFYKKKRSVRSTEKELKKDLKRCKQFLA